MENFDLTPIENLMSDSINKLNNMKTDNETILRYEILSILKSVETEAKKGYDGDYTPIVCVDSHDYYIVVNNLFSLIQAITDPENQPNQYGVKLETQILD